MKTAIELIQEKREYQKQKGYTSEHDDYHVNGEIADYAKYYIVRYGQYLHFSPVLDNNSLINDSIDYLSNAGACIVAEIERLQRLKREDLTNEEIETHRKNVLILEM